MRQNVVEVTLAFVSGNTMTIECSAPTRGFIIDAFNNQRICQLNIEDTERTINMKHVEYIITDNK